MDDSEKQRRLRARERVRSQMPTRRKKKFEVNYTVGRIEDGNAILLSSEHNILDVPLMLLPKNIKPGNILKFRVERNLELERKREAEILSI
jgi:glutamine phosphoribosylpyrophosphate amidotransferase